MHLSPSTIILCVREDGLGEVHTPTRTESPGSNSLSAYQHETPMELSCRVGCGYLPVGWAYSVAVEVGYHASSIRLTDYRELNAVVHAS